MGRKAISRKVAAASRERQRRTSLIERLPKMEHFLYQHCISSKRVNVLGKWVGKINEHFILNAIKYFAFFMTIIEIWFIAKNSTRLS